MFFFSNSSAVSVNSRRRRCRSATGRRQQTNRWFDSMEINKKKSEEAVGTRPAFHWVPPIGRRRRSDRSLMVVSDSFWVVTPRDYPQMEPRKRRIELSRDRPTMEEKKTWLQINDFVPFATFLFCFGLVSSWPLPLGKAKRPQKGSWPTN